MDVNFNFSLIGIIHQIFNLLESIGMSHEFIILALVGVGVGILLQKQYKADRKHRKDILSLFTESSRNMAKVTDDMAELKKEIINHMNRIQTHHEKCFQCANERNLKQEITRETMKEKMDTIEDGIKEIKKTLLFK